MKRMILGMMLVAAPAWAAQPAPASRAHDVQAIKSVLARYQQALERLDPSGTATLFTPDSEIIESGSVEGDYATYLAHHLTPELAEFKSFDFSDYTVAVRFEGPVALATETYRFRIVPKSGTPADRIGAATSVLRKVGRSWKIVRMHNSAHRPLRAEPVSLPCMVPFRG